MPVGEERTLAWLLSDHHLSPAELESAARRIRGGQKLAPPEELLAKARGGLQQAIPGRRRRPKPSRPPAPADTTGAAEPLSAEGSSSTRAAPEEREVAQGEPRDEPAPWVGEPNLAVLLALDGAGPPGGALPRWALWVLAASCVLLTPLPGWIAWWLWRDAAPKAAQQTLRVTASITAGTVVLWLAILAWAWAGQWGLLAG